MPARVNLGGVAQLLGVQCGEQRWTDMTLSPGMSQRGGTLIKTICFGHKNIQFKPWLCYFPVCSLDTFLLSETQFPILQQEGVGES